MSKTGLIVELVGKDGNAMAIIGRCTKAMRRAGIDHGMIDSFMVQAMDGDYDHLLQVVQEWFEVE